MSEKLLPLFGNLTHGVYVIGVSAMGKKNAEEIIISANQEIQGERQRARQALKKESVQTAVTLAERILKENLDTEKNRNLINQAIKDI